MTQRIWTIAIILSISFSCHLPTKNSEEPSDRTTEDVANGDAGGGAGLGASPEDEPETAMARLATGLYRGGLKLAIRGNTITGYYEDASGWNAQAGAPQFSCEYSFSGEYTGSDTIQLVLANYEGATGKLEVLSREKIRVSLSLNPCDNEQPSTETLEIENAYPLVAIRDVTASKSYFHSEASEATRRGSYLVKGDRAEITALDGEWAHVLFHGMKSTTEGWMPMSAFADDLPSTAITGTWLSKAGEPYEIYYKFYDNNRYKTWNLNSFEPQGMAGSFVMSEPGVISLRPCGGEVTAMSFRNAGGNEISLMMPGTKRWTVFEKRADESNREEVGFSIEKRAIVTTVNNRTVRIPSETTKAEFLNAVCPFNVTPDVLEAGEGTFDILRVGTSENGSLFYAVLDGENVTSLVIESPLVNRRGITVGSTFAELKKVIPSVAINRSEIEGKVVGSNEHFTFSFGYLDGALFDAASKRIPDSVRIKQIIL